MFLNSTMSSALSIQTLGELWKEIEKEMVVDQLDHTSAEPDISKYTCKDFQGSKDICHLT